MLQKKQLEVKTTQEKISPVKLKINFSVPAVKLDEFIKKAANEVSKEIKIDGFRSGKIPFDVVKQNVGEEKLLQEGADRAVKKFYVDYILDNKIQAIGQPEVKVKKLALGNDFEFETEVDLLPEIELKKEWKDKIKKVNTKHKDKKFEVTDKELDKELDFLANQRAKLTTVDREAQKDDQLDIDFEVFQDKVVIEGGTAKNHQMIIGKGQFIPGFENNLIGVQADEIKEFNLKFPENYHQKHLAGKEAQFKVKVNLVQERQVPEINDEFAKGIGKFKNLKELKNNIKEGLKKEKENKKRQEQEKEIIDALIAETDIEIPQVLINNEIERMKAELDSNIAQMGLNRQQYLQQIKTTEEKLEEQWKKNEAPIRVKAALILRQIADQEKIVADKKAIEERMNQILQYYKTLGQAKEDMDVKRLYENIKAELVNKSTFDYLISL